MNFIEERRWLQVTHRHLKPILKGKSRSLCLYLETPLNNDEYEKLIQTIDADIKAASPTIDNIIVFGLEKSIGAFQDFLGSATAKTLQSGGEYLFFDSSLITISRLPHFWKLAGVSVEQSPEDFVDLFAADYIETIFWTSKVVLKASSLHHFKLPSKIHSNIFIRLANGLVGSHLVDSVAFWLIDKIPGNAKTVFVDSPSILTLGYSLNRLLNSLNETNRALRILSFDSYSGIEKFSPDDKEALVLISASTGGGLADGLRKKGIKEENIVTILSVAHNSVGTVLCKPIANGQSGIPPCELYDEHSCGLCERGSSAIHILDEHFLFDRPSLNSYNIAQVDAPEWLKQFMNNWARRKYFRVNKKTAQQDNPYTLYIDTQGLISNDLKCDAVELERLFTAAIPAKLDRIIHLDDAGSEALAGYAKKLFEHQSGRAFKNVISARVLREAQPIDKGSAMVVASCATTGRDILDISRVLRDAHPDGFTSYFVYLVRAHDLTEWKDIESSLTHGFTGPNQNNLKVRYKLQFPRIFRANPWTIESKLYQEVLENYGKDLSADERAFLLPRMEYLRLNSAGGMSEQVFLPSLSGHELKIRTNFVFFEIKKEDDGVSQGDILAAIAVVLHNWRKKYHVSGKLGLSPHQRTVVSPKAFDRYNDGIIHASLLRSAAGAEFDYAWDSELSHEMTHIICCLIEAAKGDMGTRAQRAEALPEFIFALRGGVLSLCHEDLQKVKVSLADYKWPPHLSVFLHGWK